MKRIFIVGIARSGTTLLQSMIGGHSEIATFPETHFFSGSIPKQKWLRAFHKITPEHQNQIKQFFQEINLQNCFEDYTSGARNMNEWVNYLIGLMDNIANEENQEVWLEKTPMHLHYIDLISKNSNNCYFIHMVREPMSNIAALYDVSKKHPEAFKQASLEKAIKRYKQEIAISQQFVGKENHLHVHYETLVKAPQKMIKEAFEFVGLAPEDVLDFSKNVNDIVAKDESWKANNSNELQLKNKVEERLTKDEFNFLKKELSSFQPDLLNRYKT